MSESKFLNQSKIGWYRSPIDKDLLLDLMKRSDVKGWRQTLLHLVLFVFTGIAASLIWAELNPVNYVWMLPLLLVTLFIHGTIGPFMGLIAIHELQHRTVFKSKGLNELFEKIYAFISWSDYIWYQQSHAIHHSSTCHKEYDGEVVLPQKFSYKRWQFWLSMLAWNPKDTWVRINQVWNHANGRVHGDWYQFVLPAEDRILRKRHKRWAQFLIGGHSMIAIGFVLSGHPFLVVVFTFGTFYCRWLGFLCGAPQHYGLNSDVSDFRYNTRTFTCSWLTGFYYWNMQYHLEHHMFPAVPFHNLPKLRKAIEKDLPHATHGLLSTWKEMLSIREKCLADPKFKFKPSIPVEN